MVSDFRAMHRIGGLRVLYAGFLPCMMFQLFNYAAKRVALVVFEPRNGEIRLVIKIQSVSNESLGAMSMVLFMMVKYAMNI
jgi:hypothetical protein